MRKRLAQWLFAFALMLATAQTAAIAHPLGNFTINHLAKLSAVGRTLHVRYVLDIAEIPTFQIMQAAPPSNRWDDARLHAWAQSESALVVDGLHVTADGVPVSLRLIDVRARLRPGAGGLPILYWAADYASSLTAASHTISVDDRVYGDRRIGWKDIVVAPETEPTHELLTYPNALIGSPRSVSGVTFKLSAGGVASAIRTKDAEQAGMNGSSAIVRSNALSDMFSSSNRTPLFVLLTILAAFGLGALHAIEPGHGKALLAFTLVGSRATMKQAAILAASLTFAHTIGVLILGAVLFFAAGFVSESIYPWITLLSGVAVAIIGARNLARYLHARQIHAHAGGHVHAHDALDVHHHGDGDEEHTHAIAGDGPIDFRGAVVAAMSGGVAPCPAAIVVMLAALRLHQMGYGLLLIVVFSVGLASVLTALGIAVVHGSAFITHSGKFDKLVSAGPFMSAALISLVGAVMIGQGFVAQGVRAPVWILASLVVFAIAGYGLAPQHMHSHGVKEQAV